MMTNNKMTPASISNKNYKNSVRKIMVLIVLTYFILINYVNAANESTKLRQVKGKELYRSLCWSCHGDVPEHFEYSGTVDVVIEAMISGRMPPYEFVNLTEEDALEIASYVGKWCNLCHGKTMVKKIKPKNHVFRLDHGNLWCFDCHNYEDLDYFTSISGDEIPFNDTAYLCSNCHSTIYKDWKKRIHGRWVGNLSNPTPDISCSDCHNPHDVTPPFKQLVPEKPPEKPRAYTFSLEFYVITAFATFVSAVLMIYSVRR